MKKTAIVIVICLLILSLIPSVLVKDFGEVSGVEFSPDLFMHRTFRYFALFGIQIGTKDFKVWRNDFEVFLLKNNYIPPIKQDKARWYMVKDYCSWRGFHKGIARGICQELECHGSLNNDRWIKWSKENPERAKIFWPAFISASRHNIGESFYFLRFVNIGNSLEEFKYEVDEYLYGFIK
ncbi:hypothetical protein [Candidatus Uabimicrobium sp. HlEnr_7]|uniref:hypothetical protein n=1 Tax=Candidatus Uabimicrobium helgolandensis TaxID=3095367 RepID=UPI003556E7B4